MEWKIGEIKQVNGEWYQCVEQPEKYDKTVCTLCAFQGNGNCELDRCSGTYRSDKKFVIFKKLEKVGEPYEFDGHLFQSYRTFEVPIFTENYATVRESGNNSKISIEIKQNQEDMEEYKMHDAKEDIPEFDKVVDECLFGKDKLNLKPFDIQKAREGKPVFTRDGRKVRIICFDAKGKYGRYIVALVPSKNFAGVEDLMTYPNNGNYQGGHENDGDLMMLPEKKEGWVNVYKDSVYDTKDEALIGRSDIRDYIDTIKVSWEE